MRGPCLLAIVLLEGSLCPLLKTADAPLVQTLAIQGSRRPVHLDTRAGEPLDLARVERDVRHLWATGWFDDISVESAESPQGIALRFMLVEKPRLRLRRIKFEPARERRAVNLKKGVPVDALLAARLAAEGRRHLVDEGYADAKVATDIIPVGFQQADLRLKVERGQLYYVEKVQFRGKLGLEPKELEKALDATRPQRILPSLGPIWGGWRLLAPFSQRGLESDLDRLRSLYLSRGYFDAQVKIGAIEIANGKAAITIEVVSGRRYRAQRLEMSGGYSNSHLSKQLRSGEFGPELCRCLQKAREESEKRGELTFSPRLEVKSAAESELSEGRAWTGNSATADTPVTLEVKLEPTPTYRVGKIDFTGHCALSDSTLRRALVLREGEVFDRDRLRRSLARLNRLAFIEPVAQADVRVKPAPEAGVVNLTIPIKEKPRGFWALSGPLAPVGALSPLNFSIGSRLPAWGRGPLELSTYYAIMSFVAWPVALGGLVSPLGWRPLLALQRPYMPNERWQSGFFIAPQLGWRGMAAGYGFTHLAELVKSGLGAGALRAPETAIPVSWQSPRRHEAAYTPAVGTLQCEEVKPSLAWLRNAGSLVADLAITGLLAGRRW